LRQTPLQAPYRIEIMFSHLEEWGRVTARYNHCPTAFFSAIALAITVIFWH
jgi:hypothetical protein